MNTKITKISVERQDKSGQPYVSSYTKKEQARVTIQIDAPEFAGKWLSAFVELGDPIEQWKEGQPVDIVITQKGNFWNFKPNKGALTQSTGVNKLFEQLFTKLQAMDGKLDKIYQKIDNLSLVEPKVEDEPPPF